MPTSVNPPTIPTVKDVLDFGHDIGIFEIPSFNNPYQWQKNQITSKSHPLYKDGFRQLEVMGIDISQEIFRPTVEICIQGWQPILSWQFSQSA